MAMDSNHHDFNADDDIDTTTHATKSIEPLGAMTGEHVTRMMQLTPLPSSSETRSLSRQMFHWVRKRILTPSRWTISPPVRIALWCFIVFLQPWIAVRNSAHREYNSPVVLLGMVRRRDIFVVLYSLFEWMFKKWYLNMWSNKRTPSVLIQPHHHQRHTQPHSASTCPADRTDDSRFYMLWRRSVLSKWIQRLHVSAPNSDMQLMDKKHCKNDDVGLSPMSSSSSLVAPDLVLLPPSLPLPTPVMSVRKQMDYNDAPTAEALEHPTDMGMVNHDAAAAAPSRLAFYKSRRKPKLILSTPPTQSAITKRPRSRRYDKIAALMNRNNNNGVQETNSSTPFPFLSAAVGGKGHSPTAIWVFTMDQPTDSPSQEGTHNNHSDDPGNDTHTMGVNDTFGGDTQLLRDAASVAIAAQTPHLDNDDEFDANNQLSVVDSARNVSPAEDTTLQRVFKALVNPARVNFEQPKSIPKGALLPSRNANKGARQKSRGRRAAENTADHIRPIDLSASTLGHAPTLSSTNTTNSKNSQQQQQQPHGSRSAASSRVENSATTQKVVTVSGNSGKGSRSGGGDGSAPLTTEQDAHHNAGVHVSHSSLQFQSQQQPWGASDVATPTQYDDGDDGSAAALMYNDHYAPVGAVGGEEYPNLNGGDDDNGLMYSNPSYRHIPPSNPKRSNLSPPQQQQQQRQQRPRVHFDLPNDSMDDDNDNGPWGVGRPPMVSSQAAASSSSLRWHQSSSSPSAVTEYANRSNNNSPRTNVNRFSPSSLSTTTTTRTSSPSSQVPYKSPFLRMYKQYLGEAPSASSPSATSGAVGTSPRIMQNQQQRRQPLSRDDRESQYPARLSPIHGEDSPRGDRRIRSPTAMHHYRQQQQQQQIVQHTSPSASRSSPSRTSPTTASLSRPVNSPSSFVDPSMYGDEEEDYITQQQQQQQEQTPYESSEVTSHQVQEIDDDNNNNNNIPGYQQQHVQDHSTMSPGRYASPRSNNIASRPRPTPSSTVPSPKAMSGNNHAPFQHTTTTNVPQQNAFAEQRQYPHQQQPQPRQESRAYNSPAPLGYGSDAYHEQQPEMDGAGYAPNSNGSSTASRRVSDEERRTKQSLLLEMDKMRKMGHTFTRDYTYDDAIEDMEYELEMKRVNDRHASSVNGLIEAGKTGCTMLALANEKMGPFLNLDGDSEDGNFFQKINPFFDKHRGDIEALYQTYFKRGPSNPVFNILIGIVSLFVTTHFANTYGHLLRPMKAEAAAMKGQNPQRDSAAAQQQPPQQQPYYYPHPAQQQPYMPAYGYNNQPGAVPTPYPPAPYYQYQQPQYQSGGTQPTNAAAGGSSYYHNPYQQQWDNPNPYGYPTMPSQPYMPPNVPVGAIPQPQQQQQQPPVYPLPPANSSGNAAPLAPPMNQVPANNNGPIQPPPMNASAAFMNPGYVATPQPVGMPPPSDNYSQNHVQSAHLESDDPDEPVGDFPLL